MANGGFPNVVGRARWRAMLAPPPPDMLDSAYGEWGILQCRRSGALACYACAAPPDMLDSAMFGGNFNPPSPSTTT